MRFRFRLLAALFALSALFLLQVEGLWASSACSGEMEMPVAAQSTDAVPHAEACPMDERAQPHEHDGQSSRGPSCPLMPSGAASCIGGIAVLPSSAAPALGPAEDERSLASSDHATDLLLAVALLRPPRA